jgi:hypothetical protein
MALDTSELSAWRATELTKIDNFADLTDEAKEKRKAEVREQANTAYSEAREAEQRKVEDVPVQAGMR